MILLGDQIIKFKDGTQKTLEEFVLESSGGGVGAWTYIDPVTISHNLVQAFPDIISEALDSEEDLYSDIMLSITDETTKTNISMSFTWKFFKQIFTGTEQTIIWWDKALGTGPFSSNINVIQSAGKIEGKYNFKTVLSSAFQQNTHKVIFSVR